MRKTTQKKRKTEFLVTYFENTFKPHNKFYRLEIERVWFDVCLKRQWGRFGWAKRGRIEYYKTWREAENSKGFRVVRIRNSHVLEAADEKSFLFYPDEVKPQNPLSEIEIIL